MAVASLPCLDNESRVEEFVADETFLRFLERIFQQIYVEGAVEFVVQRRLIVSCALGENRPLPRDLGAALIDCVRDVFFQELVKDCAPRGCEWFVESGGKDKYRFFASKSDTLLRPNRMYAYALVPDATPPMVSLYPIDEAQLLLARARHNRLMDLFTGATCYSAGQREATEIYVGLTRQGEHYVLPVAAKGRRDRIRARDIEEDIAFCRERFPHLVCCPMAIQPRCDSIVALMQFVETGEGIRLQREAHYELIPPHEFTERTSRKTRESIAKHESDD